MLRIALSLWISATSATTAAPENAAPYFQGEEPESERSANVDELFSETFQVVDPDGDGFEVTAEGLPDGAKLRVRDPTVFWEADEGPPKETKARSRAVILTWRPTREQRGDHVVALVARDGKASERIEVTLRVQEEWESWFLPGVQYVGYFPASDRIGSFHGAAFEVVVGSWVHQTEARGPSHGRVYVDLALLGPEREDAGKAFSWALGLDLSVERNPWRRYLIPIFGLEVGGFHQRETGTFFMTTPFAGAHLFSTRNVFVTVTGGYVFAGRDIDALGGWRVRAGVNAALW
jgi:hypothetical protein